MEEALEMRRGNLREKRGGITEYYDSYIQKKSATGGGEVKAELIGLNKNGLGNKKNQENNSTRARGRAKVKTKRNPLEGKKREVSQKEEEI